jgi:undecaprenyl-diphosphatase
MILIYLWIALQIIIEVLPISSSGHLQLFEGIVSKYANLDIKNFFAVRKINIQDIYYFMHLPTVGAILICFGASWYSLFFNHIQSGMQLLLMIGIIDCITALLYWIKKRYQLSWPLGIGFVITACCSFFIAFHAQGMRLLSLNFFDAIILGVMQGIALLPGISRLALTTATACFLGFALPQAWSLAWLIYMPLMIAASAKSIIKLILTNKLNELLNPRVAFVMLGSGIVSLVIVQWITWFIQPTLFFFFGLYMVMPLAVWLLLRK